MGRELRRRNLKNGAFKLKTRQMLSIFSTPEEFKNGTITAILDLCLSKIRTENHLSILTLSFSKFSVFRMFSVHEKTKRPRYVFQIPPI